MILFLMCGGMRGKHGKTNTPEYKSRIKPLALQSLDIGIIYEKYLAYENCRYCKLRSLTIEIPRQYPAYTPPHFKNTQPIPQVTGQF
jgi:hypothetical protein